VAPKRISSKAGLIRGSILLSAILIACCCSLTGCRKGTASAASTTPPIAARAQDPATRDLLAIGDRVTTAIVARDTNTLLNYDHDPDDAASLQSKSGELYCYLFDSNCIQGSKGRAIYDLFSTARRLGIDASVTKVGDKNYGLLMFYDKSQISGTELYSPDFLCSEKALKQTASWHFIMTDGKWRTSTLFDYKTDKPCKT
jgi:hypothetical protein